MITYDLMLDRQRLIGADKFSVAANANETLSLRFDFDRHWRRFDSKTAVFRNSDGEYYIIEVKQNRVQVPWEVLKKTGAFELSVIGYEEEKVITSDMVEIEVTESLLPEDYKTFSPSEVLFDRFKRECIAQAYLDYEDEIDDLKKSHMEELIRIAQETNKSTEEFRSQLAQKDETIRQMEISHDADITALRIQLADIDTQKEYYKEKADKWDLIDRALSLKTSCFNTLWSSGTEPYELPMLNTCSMKTYIADAVGANIKTIGLDLTSMTSFSGVFNAHGYLESLTLRNTQNITDFSRVLSFCRSIKTVSIDNMDGCGTITQMFSDATNLLSVSFGTNVRAGLCNLAFNNCRLLKEINGCFDMKYATNVGSMFNNCYSLEKVRFVPDSLSLSLSFGLCPNLSKESMISIFESLSPENSGTLAVSQYAFENNFTQEERNEWLNYITESKAWVLTVE